MDSPAAATIHVGAISIDFLVDADDSGGGVTVFECTVPADAKVPHPSQPRRVRGNDLRPRGRLHLDDRRRGA
jgi:hypothetical protein